LATINLAVEILRSPLRVYDHNLYLNIIMQASGQINNLITDLLQTTPSDETGWQKYPLHQLLDEALAMAEGRILLKNITVIKSYTTLDCKISVNKQEMKLALANIIINAIDAMPSAGKGNLKLVTKSINNNCIVEIEDNGIGISKDNLKNIFTPYFTGKVGGMGLGLSTTLEILKANHAVADVESKEGNGTRFVLSFEKTRQC